MNISLHSPWFIILGTLLLLNLVCLLLCRIIFHSFHHVHLKCTQEKKDIYIQNVIQHLFKKLSSKYKGLTKKIKQVESADNLHVEGFWGAEHVKKLTTWTTKCFTFFFCSVSSRRLNGLRKLWVCLIFQCALWPPDKKTPLSRPITPQITCLHPHHQRKTSHRM